jgi:hypothetical protein
MHASPLGSPERWLTSGNVQMVAELYRAFCGIPLICAIKPGTGDSIWSIEMHSPGCVIVLSLSIVSGSALVLQARRFICPYIHAVHIGSGHLASFLGSSPFFAIQFMVANDKCPSL